MFELFRSHRFLSGYRVVFKPSKKEITVVPVFFPQSTVFLWSKFKCFGVPAGLLATVPVNPHDGTNRSNVGRVNTGGSSENLSMLGGTSRTGL